MRIPPVTLGLALLVGVGAQAQPPVRAEPAASRIVDRTVVCSVGKRAGVRKIELHAQTGTRLFEDRSQWKFRASTSVRDPSTAVLPWSIGWLAAGSPPSNAESLAISARCRTSSANVPLSPQGISGFAASPLDDEYHCVVPRRIVVRLRAVFRTATSVRLNRKWVQLTARGVVLNGALAVRTESGKPIAYATVLESGKTRLFVADGCEPDLIQSDG